MNQPANTTPEITSTSGCPSRRATFLLPVALIVGGLALAVVGAWWIFAYPHRWNNLGTERGRYQRTRSDLAQVDRALRSYAASHGGRLPEGSPVSELAPLLQPTFILKLPTVDAWNHRLIYSSDGSSWEVRSLGRDGLEDPVHGQAPVLDQDLIRRKGQEVRSELVRLVEEMALH